MPDEPMLWLSRATGAGKGENRGGAGFYRDIRPIAPGEPLK
jgi:hypothetical protein